MSYTATPKATEEEVEAIAAVVLAIVGEVTAELAVVIGEPAGRVGAFVASGALSLRFSSGGA